MKCPFIQKNLSPRIHTLRSLVPHFCFKKKWLVSPPPFNINRNQVQPPTSSVLIQLPSQSYLLSSPYIILPSIIKPIFRKTRWIIPFPMVRPCNVSPLPQVYKTPTKGFWDSSLSFCLETHGHTELHSFAKSHMSLDHPFDLLFSD